MDYCEVFIAALSRALQNVPETYFRCSNLNREVAKHYSIRSSIKKAVFTYGERAFCYELYHQLRAELGDLGNLFLHGELKKEELKLLTEDYCKILRLDKEFMPDFLLHDPVNADHQEIVMEVKSSPSLDFRSIFSDISKIDQFIARYRYKTGVFLAVNISYVNINKKLQMYRERIVKSVENRSKIHIIVTEGPQSDISGFLLSDIIG